MGRCKSPIERSLFFAFVVAGGEIFTAVTYVRDGVKSGDDDRRVLDVLYVEPQAKLGEYKVDFLLTVVESIPDDEHSVTHKDGRIVPGTKEIKKYLIVECDGHKFHEKTKEQAKKDKQRDRMLQKIGYRVFHYTGSEIWADVFKCAHEVMEVLSVWK